MSQREDIEQSDGERANAGQRHAASGASASRQKRLNPNGLALAFFMLNVACGASESSPEVAATRPQASGGPGADTPTSLPQQDPLAAPRAAAPGGAAAPGAAAPGGTESAVTEGNPELPGVVAGAPASAAPAGAEPPSAEPPSAEPRAESDVEPTNPETDYCRPAPAGPIAAFPGAEGFGAFARGGRNGDVYHVTNLNATGAGSFANGILTATDAGRTIVFDVSGYAEVSGTLRATHPFLTIAGQTAPGDGFGLKGGTFLLSAADAIIRHIRFRDGRGGDAVDMDSNAINFIWDHCDMLFSHDENMSSFGTPPDNMTYQYSINAWGLETHSAGGLWDQGRATSHHSLWAHNHTRNPKARALLLDWVNNVTFDWDIGFIMGDSETPALWQANVLGNYFVSGTPKEDALETANLDRNGNPNFHLFMAGSLLDGNVNGVLDVTKTDFDAATGDYERLSAPVPLTANFQPASANNPIIGLPVTLDDALTAHKKVVSTVGPLRLDVGSDRPLRDEVDALLIDDLVTQRHRHLTYEQTAATGIGNDGFGTLESTPAPRDTDQDGMPDYWEQATGLSVERDEHTETVPNCTFAYVPANAGYTWLEDYLQFLAIPHGTVGARTATDGSEADTYLEVDLRRFTSGLLPGAEFSVSRAVNGTVTVMGSTARFVPTANYVGRAGFSFSGTDADGSTLGSDVGVLVSSASAR